MHTLTVVRTLIVFGMASVTKAPVYGDTLLRLDYINNPGPNSFAASRESRTPALEYIGSQGFTCKWSFYDTSIICTVPSGSTSAM